MRNDRTAWPVMRPLRLADGVVTAYQIPSDQVVELGLQARI